MQEDKRRFVILMEEQSYLETSFKESFKKQGLDVDVISVSQNDNSLVPEDTRGLLVCTSTELLKKTISVKVVVDQLLRNNVPVFVMGNKEDLSLLWNTMSKQMFVDIFTRPINMVEMVESICKQMDDVKKKSKKKILAVDDSGIILRNIKNLLEDRYQVVMANSGAMAIKYLTLNTPDLILLDYEMPIVDGKQVMQMIREDSEFRKIPIIFLTGKNDAETVMKVIELKPDGYLLKTMEPKKLHKAIDDFFMNGEDKG